MNYFDTFIQFAPDCPAKVAVIPTAKGEKESIAVFEYELLYMPNTYEAPASQ